MRKRSRHELRCFCSREPILCIWGTDERSVPYVHIKVYKQSRIYGEIVVYGGEVKIICRECLRWHRIMFVEARAQPELVETAVPREVEEDIANAAAAVGDVA